MTVTGLLNKLQFTGDGVTVDFPFANTLYTVDALGVILTDGNGLDIPQVIETDYTISIAGDFATATVEMVSPPLNIGGSGPAAEILTIFRTEPDTQTLDYVEGGGFPADSTEIALDKATMESQTQAEQLKRSLKLPVTLQDDSNGAFDGEMNSPSELRQYIQWNDTTKVFEIVNPITSQEDIGGVDKDDVIWLSDTSDDGKLKKVTILDLGFAATEIPNLVVDEFIDGVDYISGTTIELTLSSPPIVVSNTQIYFDGVYQEKSTYTLLGSVITFDAVIPLDVSGVSIVSGSFVVSTTVVSVNGSTGVVVIDADDISDAATVNKFTTAGEITKLDGIEALAEVNQTNAVIKTQYEANTDTNNFDNAAQDKLGGISAGAQVNPDVVSQAEAEAGVATTERIWTAERVRQAIDALGPGVANTVAFNTLDFTGTPTVGTISLPLIMVDASYTFTSACSIEFQGGFSTEGVIENGVILTQATREIGRNSLSELRTSIVGSDLVLSSGNTDNFFAANLILTRIA